MDDRHPTTVSASPTLPSNVDNVDKLVTKTPSSNVDNIPNGDDQTPTINVDKPHNGDSQTSVINVDNITNRDDLPPNGDDQTGWSNVDKSQDAPMENVAKTSSSNVDINNIKGVATRANMVAITSDVVAPSINGDGQSGVSHFGANHLDGDSNTAWDMDSSKSPFDYIDDAMKEESPSGEGKVEEKHVAKSISGRRFPSRRPSGREEEGMVRLISPEEYAWEKAQKGNSSSYVRRGPSGPSRETLEMIRERARIKMERRTSEKGIGPGVNSSPSRAKAAPEGTTVSQKTLEDYLRRGRGLFNRYRREMGAGHVSADELSPVEFVNWLFSIKATVASSTWRLYRLSAANFIEGFPSAEVDTALAMLDNDVIDISRKPKVLDGEETIHSRKGRMTSALKEKRFPRDDFNRVITYLTSFRRTKYAAILVDWLRAGILTGLRPNEWKATDIEVRADEEAPHGRYIWLYVLNSKATNGRGNGVVRTLDLSHMSNNDIAVINRMAEWGREWMTLGNYALMQSNCASLLYDVNKTLWPKRKYCYSLYSTRHQAIANWKSYEGFAEHPEFISAIVGHGVTSTMSENYGKRRSAWEPEDMPEPPRAVPEEASMVKQQIRLFNQRVKLEQEAGLRKTNDNPEFPIG